MFRVKRIQQIFVSSTLSILSALSLLSCRQLVFEDRTDCPSWVHIQAVPEINPRTWESFSFSVWEDGVSQEARTATVYELNRGFYTPARKNHYFEAAILGGWPEDWMSDEAMIIPEGEECPEGYGAYFGMGIGTEEIYEAPLELTQLFVNVTLTVKGASSGYAFNMVCEGTVDGYVYPGDGVHYGPFSAEAKEESYLKRNVRIPRQIAFYNFTRADGDGLTEQETLDALVVDVFVENQKTEEMVFYKRVPLGRIMTDSGYDWLSARPADVDIIVEMANESIVGLSVVIGGWEKVLIPESGSYVI